MILKNILSTLIYVIILGLVSFYTNLFIVQRVASTVNTQELSLAYFGNAVMAFAIVALMYLLQKRFKEQLGFVFMATSVLKFAFFFIVFYPRYHADGHMTKQEFLIFFVPYLIFLIFEIVVLSRFLNRIDD